MDGGDDSLPQRKAAQQPLMVSFYLHSLLTSSISPVLFTHTKLDKDNLCLWLSGALNFPGLVFIGVSSLTATGCIYILDMVRCFVPVQVPMVLAWDECIKCLYLFLEGEGPTPFLLWYPYREWETRKVSFGSKDPKEVPKKELFFFFLLWTHMKEMNFGTHSGSLHSTCVP